MQAQNSLSKFSNLGWKLNTVEPISNSGFTVTELLVVVIVIGIFASIALPSFLGLMQGCFLNQSACINQDPVGKKCDLDKKTKDVGRSGEVLIQLRYSAKCHMTWPRVIAQNGMSIAGTKIYVLDDQGNKYGLSTVQAGNNVYYGDMGPGYALGACAILPDKKKVCTEGVTLMLFE